MQTDIDYLICIPVHKVSKRVYECMDTIGDKNVLLIDNSGKRECEVFESYGFQIEYQDENIGVPRAWNIGLKKNHDWTFIVSCSMIFNKPFSHIIEMLKDYNGLMFRTTSAWHCNGINKKLVEQIGYFDENFYPGYFEDCDWDHRCRMLGIDEYGNIPIDAYCQVDGGATIDGIQVKIHPLHDYFKIKWGGENTWKGWGEHKHPFNNPNNPLSYWPEFSISTLKRKYGLK